MGEGDRVHHVTSSQCQGVVNKHFGINFVCNTLFYVGTFFFSFFLKLVSNLFFVIGNLKKNDSKKLPLCGHK